MQLGRKLRNFLIYLTLISFGSTAIAGPSVLRIYEGEPAPYDGWCLTDTAMAKIVADKELEGERCKLKLDKLSEELGARYKLNLDILQARVASVHSEHLSMMKIKNEEIKRLEEVALEKPNNYWYLWTAGGFVIGATTVLSIWSVMVK